MYDKGNTEVDTGKVRFLAAEHLARLLAMEVSIITEWIGIIGTRGVMGVMAGAITMGARILWIITAGAWRCHWELIHKTNTLKRTRPRRDWTDPNLAQANGMH